MRQTLVAVCAAAVLASCGTSHTNTVQTSQHVPVKTIAMMPGGGVLADAVAIELSSRGFTVIDPTSTSSLMMRLNLNEVEITRPEALSKLHGQGIDALLVVRSAAGYDQQPQSASARMTSAESGALVAGVTWENGFGGQAGSVADRVMRKGLSQAATEIASELATRARQS